MFLFEHQTPSPSWVTWVSMSNVRKDLKHPMTPGYITEDVSQHIHRMYSTSDKPGSARNTQEWTGLTTKNRLVSTGETAGCLERRHGSGWVSTPS